MELFFHYAPSNENREKLMKVIAESANYATGVPHRFETLHSTLAYLGEVEEERLPELMEIVKNVTARHAALPASGERVYLSHSTKVYNAWGLLYVWQKTPQMQEVYEEINEALQEKGFWSDYQGEDYMPHSTLWMKYYPNDTEKEILPAFPACEDLFDTVVISQVTVIDGHVAYYPLYASRFSG